VGDGTVSAVDHMNVAAFLEDQDVVLVVWVKLEANN
jgi:hypothetical protein